MQESGVQVAADYLALPAQPTPLIGREGELEGLKAKLLQPEVRLLSLTGPGGVGKTRLALAVAEALTWAFEGVAFTDLSVLSDPERVAPSILQSFGERERGRETPVEALKRTLADRSYLLILDNSEPLRLEDVSQILQEHRAALCDPEAASFARNTGQARHLLTDRETQVLSLVAEGMTNKRIARVLSISEKPSHGTSRTSSTSSASRLEPLRAPTLCAKVSRVTAASASCVTGTL